MEQDIIYSEITKGNWYALSCSIKHDEFSMRTGQIFQVEQVLGEASKMNTYLKKYNLEVKNDDYIGFIFSQKDEELSYLSNEEALEIFLSEEKKFLELGMQDIAYEQAKLVQEKQAFQKVQEKIAPLKRRMQNLGFFSAEEDSRKTGNKNYSTLPHKYGEWLPLIQQQLAKRGFYYSIDTIRLFFTALHTNELVILTGPSGTGKTSIVEQMADLFDAECEIIPVQSSWHDSQDLLGFYNPLSHQYSATPFVDVLVEAAKPENSEKIYFICLDELNLANVEYYLADILSIRETRKKELRLYSDSEYQKNKAEISFLKPFIEDASIESVADLQDLNLDMKYFAELLAREKNMLDYQPSIPFPDNVRIIGTMNIEGLVNPLSPKIVDRAFIIPIEDRADKIETETDEIIRTYPYLFNHKPLRPLSEQPGSIEENFKTKIEFFGKINITANPRVEKHIRNYFLHSFIPNEDMILDDVLLTKILPKIHILKEDFEEDVAASLVFPKHGNSQSKFDEMLANVDKHRLLSFWT